MPADHTQRPPGRRYPLAAILLTIAYIVAKLANMPELWR